MTRSTALAAGEHPTEHVPELVKMQSRMWSRLLLDVLELRLHVLPDAASREQDQACP